ncbi:hypothetical protein [Falsiroseomonas sp.]|uniref:hypothetical protein n=1 Tax=Falsiroseomonas sp. TaxID=2870721 RepID=UPI0034A2EED5
MTDIVERLLTIKLCEPGCSGECKDCPGDIASDAADEIERLREALIRERHGWQAEVERLRREVMRAGGGHG